MTASLMISAVSTVVGYIMRYLAERRKEQAAIVQQSLQKIEAHTASADAAAARGGVWMRRVIVCSMVLALFAAPLINGWFGFSTFVEVQEMRGFWGRLFGPDHVIKLVPIEGPLITLELRQAFLAIICFYFGQGAAK